ncbi:hypothetical protein KDA06_02005 [Candidatus Saccharibacteria bacterium]|nr:hypothetical protein [Candidatus Saccharibacteria bacterium]
MVPGFYVEQELPSLIEQLTDRQVGTPTHITDPMAAALEAGFGVRAEQVAKKLTNQFANTELFAPAAAPTNKDILTTLGRLTDVAAESYQVAFGATLLLGSMATTYQPQAEPKGRLSRSASACAAVAQEVLRNNHSPYEELTQALLSKNLSPDQHRAVCDDFSSLLFDVVEAIKQTKLRQPLGQTVAETTPAVPTLDVQEILSSERVSSALPWIREALSDDNLPIAELLYDHGEPIAWTIDVSPLNDVTREITEEALGNNTADAQRFREVGFMRMIRGGLRANTARTDVVYHKNIGSNHKLLRAYYAKIGSSGALPILLHLGTSRTKENQARLLTIINNDGATVRKHDIGS